MVFLPRYFYLIKFKRDGGGEEKRLFHGSVDIRWTSDDARLPGQFAVMAGTADRALRLYEKRFLLRQCETVSQFIASLVRIRG